MSENEKSFFMIVSREEAYQLFQNQIQVDIFMTIIERIVKALTDRTTLHGIQLHLE